MAIVIADRVKESTLSVGTGTITLGGPEGGFQSFSAGIGVGNSTYYTIFDPEFQEYETGIGTVIAGTPQSLSRDQVLSSSNENNKVNFGSSKKLVFCSMPAVKAVVKDETGLIEGRNLAVDGSVLDDTEILALAAL
jgi:hypothetical protein